MGVAVIPKAAPGVLGISKRVKEIAEQVPLQLHILLRVGVLGEKKVPKGGVVPGQNYTDISNIYIINMRILYLLNRHSSWVNSRS